MMTISAHDGVEEALKLFRRIHQHVREAVPDAGDQTAASWIVCEAGPQLPVRRRDVGPATRCNETTLLIFDGIALFVLFSISYS
jgi:hypothetical protein